MFNYTSEVKVKLPDTLSIIVDEIAASHADSSNNTVQPITQAIHPNDRIEPTKLRIETRTPIGLGNDNSNTVLGWVHLAVPPSKISIKERRYNEEIPTLRSTGAALVKTGHGHVSINLPIDFTVLDDNTDSTGANTINNHLRHIIAQFRTCPFTTLENDVVSSVINTKGNDQGALARYKAAVRKRDAALDTYK